MVVALRDSGVGLRDTQRISGQLSGSRSSAFKPLDYLDPPSSTLNTYYCKAGPSRFWGVRFQGSLLSVQEYCNAASCSAAFFYSRIPGGFLSLERFK